MTNSTPLLHIGCSGLPPRMSLPHYFSQLSTVEVSWHKQPSAKTLRRWKQEAPENTSFVVHAQHTITYPESSQSLDSGHFLDTDKVRDAAKQTCTLAHSLSADAIFFKTPASFSPSMPHRDAMNRFFTDTLPVLYKQTNNTEDLPHFVWEPDGLWDRQTAATFAHRLGLLYAQDILTHEDLLLDPSNDTAYFRSSGLGIHRKHPQNNDLLYMLERLTAVSKAWVIFGNDTKFRAARKLQSLYNAM